MAAVKRVSETIKACDSAARDNVAVQAGRRYLNGLTADDETRLRLIDTWRATMKRKVQIRKQQTKRRKELRKKALKSQRPEPRFMVVLQDTTSGSITPEQACHAYRLLATKAWVQPTYHPVGRFQQCYLNVDRFITENGGSKVLGWWVDLNSGAAARNSNKCAHINLEGHAIWMSPEGHLVDVTTNPEGRAYQFIPHEAVVDYYNGGITFHDTLLLAKTWDIAKHAQSQSARDYARRMTKMIVPVRASRVGDVGITPP